jgi:hypothetical protein
MLAANSIDPPLCWVQRRQGYKLGVDIAEDSVVQFSQPACQHQPITAVNSSLQVLQLDFMPVSIVPEQVHDVDHRIHA